MALHFFLIKFTGTSYSMVKNVLIFWGTIMKNLWGGSLRSFNPFKLTLHWSCTIELCTFCPRFTTLYDETRQSNNGICFAWGLHRISGSTGSMCLIVTLCTFWKWFDCNYIVSAHDQLLTGYSIAYEGRISSQYTNYAILSMLHYWIMLIFHTFPYLFYW